MASLKLFNINAASVKAYVVILFGLVSFFIGSISTYGLIQKVKINNNDSDVPDFNIKTDINYTYIYILCGIAFCVLVSMALKSINLMMSGYTLSDVRYTLYYDKVANVGIVNFLYTYLARPVTIIMMPISILIFLISSERKRKILILVIAITLVALVVISSGERLIVLDFIIYFFVTNLIHSKLKHNELKNDIKNSKKNNKKHRKNKYLVIIVIGIMLIAIAQVTINRGSSVTKTLYTYLVGCVPALSIKIEYFDHIRTYTYGLTSIKGFIRPFLVFLNNAGVISSMPKLYLTSETLTQQIENLIYIGPNIRYNGFVSTFYYFYLDLGMYGVMGLSFLYGVVCSQAYSKIKNKLNMKNCILYLLLAQSMLTSMFQFEFSNICFAMSFYYLIIIFMENKGDGNFITRSLRYLLGSVKAKHLQNKDC